MFYSSVFFFSFFLLQITAVPSIATTSTAIPMPINIYSLTIWFTSFAKRFFISFKSLCISLIVLLISPYFTSIDSNLVPIVSLS